MFTRSKSELVKSVVDRARRGNKDRIETYFTKSGDNYTLHFRDYGGYNKERYWAEMTLDSDEVEDLIQTLQALKSGEIDNTHVPYDLVEQPAPPDDVPTEQ